MAGDAGPTTERIDQAFAGQRLPYDDRGLRERGLEAGDLDPTPLEQFRRWYDEAVTAGVVEPNAMTLATIGADGLPTARTVLLKHAEGRGFVFFTNYTSRKGRELAERPVAALVLPWLPLHRQVAVKGRVERVDEQATAEYFATRPWGSRIGAWASHQSRPAGSREVFEERYAQLADRWPDRGRPDDVPVPPFWGGFLVRPVEVEFWQGRPSRLHDRLAFRSSIVDGDPPPLDAARDWSVERREP